MTNEEIFIYLRENLKVVVTNRSDQDCGIDTAGVETSVKLLLTNPKTLVDELISEDTSCAYFSVRY